METVSEWGLVHEHRNKENTVILQERLRQKRTKWAKHRQKKRAEQTEYQMGTFKICRLLQCDTHSTSTEDSLKSQLKTINGYLLNMHIYRNKKVKRDKERAPECERNRVRTVELHNGKKQHGSYQRGAPGLPQVAEWRIALPLSNTHIHKHTRTNLNAANGTNSHWCAPHKRSHSHTFIIY